MMKVFFDTNIILDILDARRKSADTVSIIVEMAKKGEFEVIVTTQSILDSYYITSRCGIRKEEVDRLTKWMMSTLNVRFINEFDLREALKKDNPDFEDSCQLAHADFEGCEFFLTNDRKVLNRTDFSPIKMMTPEQFVDKMRIS